MMERLFHRDLTADIPSTHIKLPFICKYCYERLLDGADKYKWNGHVIELQYRGCPTCGWWLVEYFDCDTEFPYGEDEHWSYFQSILCSLYTNDALGMCCREVFKEITANPELIYSLSPRQVEGIVGGCFRGIFNCAVEMTKTTRDGGKDLVCFDSEKGPFIIEVKKFRQTRKVGVSVVREFLGAMVIDKIHKGFIVTTSSFSTDSIQLQNQLRNDSAIDIELKDIEDIKSWLRLSFSKYFDIERIKATICYKLGGSVHYPAFPLANFPLSYEK